jgi:hypothetical protein
MFKKVREEKQIVLQATKNQFHKSLSRIRESFNKGKDLINDDLQEMEICVQEIKQARRKHNINIDMTRLNEPEYDSDLSDFDKNFFSSSGRFNINKVQSSLACYNSTKPKKKTGLQQNYSQYSSLKLTKNVPENFKNKSKQNPSTIEKLGNKTCNLISSPELTSSKVHNKKRNINLDVTSIEQDHQKNSQTKDIMFDQSKSEE